MALASEAGTLQASIAAPADGGGLTVPDANLLFTGDFSRAGHDLILTGQDGANLVLAGYFNTDHPPSLVSLDGAMLTGDIVTSLAGPQFPAQYAQVGDAPSGVAPIGQVQSVQGSASVVRADGATEPLNVGDPVFQGDVVQTGLGSKLGISFIDGTVFSLSASARMVLNSLVYDPDGGQSNSLLFSLVEGTFVFAAGQIAPTGDMKIQTPVATMGIRGTAPTVTIDSQTGTVNFSIVPNPGDGHIGSYTLLSLITGLPIGTVSAVGTKWQITGANGQIIELDKTEEDLLDDAEAIGQINSVFSQWQSSNQQNPNGPQAGPDNNGPPGSSGLNEGQPGPNGPGLEGPGPNNPPGNNPPPNGDPPPGGNPNGPPGGNNPPGSGADVPPVAVPDIFATSENGTTTFSVLGNDRDPDGNTAGLTVVSFNAVGILGALVLNQDNTFTYDPGSAFDALAPGQTAQETFTYVLQDAQGLQDTGAVTVVVNGVNDGPAITGDLGISVDEGGSVVVTITDLGGDDPDDDATGLTYTVTSGPTNGQLELIANQGVAVSSFTQGDIDNGRVVYVHDGSETTSDAYDISLADGGEDGATPATATIDVAVAPVNDSPAIAGDFGISVDEGSSVAVTTSDLTGSDPDDGATGLTYTVTSGPTNGQLELAANQGVMVTSFTQDDIENGRVVYVHDGSDTTSDAFDVSLADGGEGGAVPATATVNVGVEPAVNVIYGSDDNDIIIGSIGNDKIFGGAGNDLIFGGSGNDVIDGGADSDFLIGGPGDDIFVLAHLDLDNLLELVIGAASDSIQEEPRFDVGDLIADFGNGADAIDLTALFDLSDVSPVDQSELGGFVEYDSASGGLFVDPAGGSADVSASGIRVATLLNSPASITVIVDDGAGNTSAEIV